MPNFDQQTGLYVSDLRSDANFAGRQLHQRDTELQMAGLERLTKAMLEEPENVLQVLVDAAVDLCGADSAGISIEREDRTDTEYYHWLATAGVYSGFLDAILPREPSACGMCLERSGPQHFLVNKTFFDILGVEAPLVTDGILLPWHTEDTRGTIFVMAHERSEAFDSSDVRLMTMLANFAAMGYREQKRQVKHVANERASAAAQMANELAHKINNPLQAITNNVYILAKGLPADQAAELGQALSADVDRLSELVRKLLALQFVREGSPVKMFGPPA